MEKGNDRWLAEQLISIVEHDSSAREALMGLVRALGFKVAGFRSATEFLLSAASRRTACLIAGLQLPESSGFDLYLRLSSEGTPIATVLITAYSNELVRQRVLNAGVAGCLTKPVNADDLFASICTALGQNHRSEKQPMSQLAMKDGTQIHYKDWGAGQPVVFSHGWPLGADAWEAQMMFLADRGYRTIGHDRRGHGRSSQPWHGNEMDTYADDLAALIEHLDLQDAVLVGHSTGGGEVARYIGRHGTRRVAKVVLVGAVPPLMLKTDANPDGLPMEVFDGIRAASLADRSQLYKDLAAGPFFGFNRPGAKVSQGMIDSFWRQGMMAGHKNTFDCIKAFSETDFTEDLKAFDVPTLIIHGDDDQVVPIDASARAAVKLVKGAILNVYPGGAHGLADTSRDQLNADLLDFINT